MNKAKKEKLLGIIDQISALTWDIRGDWTDPRSDCREIMGLCSEAKELIKEAKDG